MSHPQQSHPRHMDAVPAPAGPHRPARSGRALRLMGWLAAGAVFLILFLFLLLGSALIGGASGLVIGLGLAVLPVPVVIATFLWIDRVEPEPFSHLLFAFVWGATVAVFFGSFINLLGDSLIGDGGLVAPFSEESLKGLAVMLFVWFRRKEFDGVVDGIVLAGFTAAGFAFTENIEYFAEAFANGGVPVALGVFVLRGIFSPFAHPLFTSMIGIGLGVAVASRRPSVKVAAPVLGWCGAVLLHFIWNYSAGVGTFVRAYLLIMVPVFAGMIGLVLWSRRLELKVLERHLPAYAAAGWVADWELPALTTSTGRRRARDWAAHTLGTAGRKAMVDLQLAATELAFLREKAARDQDPYDFAHRERELLGLLAARKQVLVPAATGHPFGTEPVPTNPLAGPLPPAPPRPDLPQPL